MRIWHLLFAGVAPALFLAAPKPAANSILSCQSRHGSSRIEIIEREPFRGARLRWHRKTGVEHYRLEERSPGYYRFVLAHPETSDTAHRIRLDRVTGEMHWTTYIAKRSPLARRLPWRDGCRQLRRGGLDDPRRQPVRLLQSFGGRLRALAGW